MQVAGARFDGGSIAENYKYRLAYHPVFFRNIVAALDLRETSRPLDLCCGQGEIARLLSSYCAETTAVDVSHEMLRRAHRSPRIRYLRADVNDAGFPSIFRGQRFTHCFIGRAIHWIDQDSLDRITQSIFQKPMWLVTMSTGFSRKTPWLQAYYGVRARHGSLQTKLNHGADSKVLKAGFALSQKRVAQYEAEVTVEYLFGNALSYSTSRIQDEAAFKADLKLALVPWLGESGKLRAEVSSSARIYRLEP